MRRKNPDLHHYDYPDEFMQFENRSKDFEGVPGDLKKITIELAPLTICCLHRTIETLESLTDTPKNENTVICDAILSQYMDMKYKTKEL